MSEKKESTQIGARVDSGIAKWIRETADSMGISQGELIGQMAQNYVKNEASQKYPEWSAQIEDVHYWAKSLEEAFMAQIRRSSDADKRARFEVQKILDRKDKLIAEQQDRICELQEIAMNIEDTRVRMEDLRTVNESLRADKKRLEEEVQRLRDQLAQV